MSPLLVQRLLVPFLVVLALSLAIDEATAVAEDEDDDWARERLLSPESAADMGDSNERLRVDVEGGADM